MDSADITKQILDGIAEIQAARKMLDKIGNSKAETLVAYEKKLATVMMQLKNGVEIKLDNTIIKSPSVTLIPKLAAGICWKERLAMEVSSNKYKGLTVGIETLKIQINALQSIFRHQNEASQ